MCLAGGFGGCPLAWLIAQKVRRLIRPHHEQAVVSSGRDFGAREDLAQNRIYDADFCLCVFGRSDAEDRGVFADKN